MEKYSKIVIYHIKPTMNDLSISGLLLWAFIKNGEDMISKEKLEELIKQEANVWVIYNSVVVPYKFINSELNNELVKNYDDNGSGMFYETKEEAEFVAKNHDIRVEKFEPPFELTDEQTYYFNDKNGFKSVISFDKGSKVGDEDVYIIFSIDFYNSYILRYITNDYTKAVDYAHKLFKGEE